MRNIATKLLASVAAALTLFAVGLNSASAEGERIIVVSHGQANDAFWSVVKNAVEIAGKDMNVNVDYRAPETFDMVAMAQLIEAAVQQEPDGLVVSLPDADALGGAVKRAVDAGIPVVSMNSGSDVAASLGVLFHVGQEEYDAGVGAGQRMKEMGIKKLICVNHEVGNVALDLRCKGVDDGYGGGVKVVPTAANTVDDVYAKVKASLQAEDDIDGIVTLGASNAGEPAIKAINELGLQDQITLGTFDLSANMLEAIRDGQASFAIDQQQFLQGYLPIVHLALYARYKVLPGGDLPTGPGFVTQDNAADVIDLAAKGLR
ncbi:MAG: sugar ABC transporter substrate-binding protein [Gammaproteobacteria bacterium]